MKNTKIVLHLNNFSKHHNYKVFVYDFYKKLSSIDIVKEYIFEDISINFIETNELEVLEYLQFTLKEIFDFDFDLIFTENQTEIYIHVKDFDNVLDKYDKRLEIELTNWSNSCADGCCYEYGLETKVNGVVIDTHNGGLSVVLQKVLEHLGYKVNINEDY